jgi:hypothetical protein
MVNRKTGFICLTLLIGILGFGAYRFAGHSAAPKQVATNDPAPSVFAAIRDHLAAQRDCQINHGNVGESACVEARDRKMRKMQGYIEPQPQPRLPIDDPVTEANGLRLDFGNAVLLVPPSMFESRVSPSDRSQASKISWLAFTFWYPSMEPSNLWGPKSPPPGSMLLIYVSWLVYSPDGPPGNRSPRPSDILANHIDEIGVPDISPSPYPGLRSVSYLEASLKKFPSLRNQPLPPSSGRVYIQTVDSPYELYMVCGSSCTANIYSKAHHFSMQVTVYGDDKFVAPRADEIFRKINRLVESWLVK